MSTTSPIARWIGASAAALWLAAGVLAAAEPIPVRTAALRDLLVEQQRSVPASVEALNRSRVSAELAARVEQIGVRVGDEVRAGAVLLRLDCRAQRSALVAARAAVAENRARLDFAEQQLARARDLQRQRSISEELAQQRHSELGVLQAQASSLAESLRQAEIQVERCEIRAPFDAWVRARLVGLGEYATPGLPLLELVQRAAVEVSAVLRDKDAEGLRGAEGLWFSYGGDRFPVQLRRLPPVLDGAARTREARLEFTGAAAPVGAAGRLVWQPPGHAIAAEFIVRRGEQLGLFLAEGGSARFHPLPDAVEGQPARVELPLEVRVVTAGRQILKDGDPLGVE